MRLIYGLFGFATIIMLGFILLNTSHIKSDVYELLELDISQNQKNALSNIQDNLSRNIAFLSDDYALIEHINILNEKYDIFSQIRIQLDVDKMDYVENLALLKIATLDKQTSESIINGDFFAKHLQEIFNNFAFRPLSLSEDFFNLAGHSSLFNIDNNIKLDINNHRFYTQYNEKTYYFAFATLKENANLNNLLNLIDELEKIANEKNADFIANGGAIFSAVAKQEGNIESIYMSLISLTLVGILLLAAFGSWHIFKLIFIIIFSFLCGLSAAFLILKDVHLLSIVISTSLIGLILDFAMHYLGHRHNKIIKPENMLEMRRIFFVALVVTSLGYGLFLLSPMKFLHQVAIISIFSLIGAFLATYFLLPLLLENKSFKSSRIFRIFIIKCYKLSRFALHFQKILVLSIGIILLVGLFELRQSDLKDNIKSYSNLPEKLVNNAKRFSNIAQGGTEMQFAIIESKNSLEDENALIESLLEHHLIDGFDGLSKIFLSQNKQENLKSHINEIRNNKQIISMYKQAGFTQNDLVSVIDDINSLSALGLYELLQNPLSADFSRFIATKENLDSPNDSIQSIVFLKNPKKNEEFYKILESHNASFVDFTELINNSFTNIKNNAIVLKVGAYALAWIILWLIFGFKNSSIMVGVVLIATLLSISILLLLGFTLNIFAIFGLILASAVGVDYVIFALNPKLGLYSKFFSILMANLTSIISFSLLITSKTAAISSFGMSASLCMFFCAVFALLLSSKKIKTTISN